MNVRKMPKEELELLSFTDIAYYLIKTDNEVKATAPLFKEICLLLELEQTLYEEKIADFFALMTTDKRFTLLNNGMWDLKSNHLVSLENALINEEDEDFEDINEEYEEIITVKNDDEFVDPDDDIEDEDEEFSDLEIIETDEEEEE